MLVQSQSLVTGVPVLVFVVVADHAAHVPLVRRRRIRCDRAEDAAPLAIACQPSRARPRRRAPRGDHAFGAAGPRHHPQPRRRAVLHRGARPGRSSTTPTGIARARSRTAIRRVVVAEVDRSWLDVVVGQASKGHGRRRCRARPAPALASAMSTDQRTAMRALLVAIRRSSGLRAATTFSIAIVDEGRSRRRRHPCVVRVIRTRSAHRIRAVPRDPPGRVRRPAGRSCRVIPDSKVLL